MPELEHKEVDLELLGVSQEGEFEGHASTFGNRDLQNDVIESGAFRETLRKKGGRVVLLWQHNRDEPIGSIIAEEDSKGLKVQGQLALGVKKAAEALELLRAKIITGLSIGFKVVKEEFDRVTGVRILKQLNLWEVSLVTWGATG